MENVWEKKSRKPADNTRGLRTTKQTKPRPVAAAPHPITPAYVENGQFMEEKKKGGGGCVGGWCSQGPWNPQPCGHHHYYDLKPFGHHHHFYNISIIILTPSSPPTVSSWVGGKGQLGQRSGQVFALLKKGSCSGVVRIVWWGGGGGDGKKKKKKKEAKINFRNEKQKRRD